MKKDNQNELRDLDSYFFRENTPKNSGKIIGNIARRIYGIEHRPDKKLNAIYNNDTHFEEKKLSVSAILHETATLANILAFRAHTGIKWRRDSIYKMRDGLLSQLSSGRFMEILLCEAMMKTEN